MKVSWNCVLFSAALIWGGFGGEAAEATAAAPHIKFAEEVFDFKTVKSGELVKHSFVFTNTGSATLNIVDVRPGCGCTTAGTWDKTVEPGKTGSIPLQFNSTGFGGKVTKMATVTCNDPERPSIMLQITGTVWRPLDFTPTMAIFNMPPEGQTNETKTIRIVNNTEDPVTLSEPGLKSSSFKAELATIKAGKEFELRVTALPPFTNAYASAPIQIKTSSKDMPQINTTAYVTVLPAVQVMPQQLMLPPGPLLQNGSWSITIRANTQNRLTLSDAAINYPGAFLALNETEPGKSFLLTVGLPAGFQAKPGQPIEVTLKSSNPQHPIIRIPITQPQQQLQNVVARIPGAAGPVH